MLDDASSQKLSTSTNDSIFSIDKRSKPFQLMSSPKRFKDIDVLGSLEGERTSRSLHDNSSNESNKTKDSGIVKTEITNDDSDSNATQKETKSSGEPQGKSSSSEALNDVKSASTVNKRKKKPTKSNELLTKLIDEESIEDNNDDCDYLQSEYKFEYNEENNKNGETKASPVNSDYDEYENGHSDEHKENGTSDCVEAKYETEFQDLEAKSTNGLSRQNSKEDISDECCYSKSVESTCDMDAENESVTESKKLATSPIRFKNVFGEKFAKDRFAKANQAIMITKLMKNKSRGILNGKKSKKTDKLSKNFDKSRAFPKFLPFNKLKVYHSLSDRKPLAAFPPIKQKIKKPVISTFTAPNAPAKTVQNHEVTTSKKKQMRYQCRFCSYKSHSVSLMQNHIYRHIDKTPYSCYYCGHKSTTKSTIMVHIELCHPNMEVKIEESRVKEEEYFLDLNVASCGKTSPNDSPCYDAAKHFDSVTTKNHNSSDAKGDLTTSRKFSESFHDNDSKETAEANHDSDLQNDGFINSKLSKKKYGQSTQDEEENSEEQLPHFITKPAITFKDNGESSKNSFRDNLKMNLDQRSQKADFAQPSSSPRGLSMINGNLTKTVFSNEQGADSQEPQEEGDDSYITVFNRPKQYFGSLYEPDKQYSCKLCSYTTNHKPSMEDHVYVHTNKRPYKCGYCNEEIYTRYAATYHNKYKHPGEPRNFIKDEQDVSIYYVNRAHKNSMSSNSGAQAFAKNDADSSETKSKATAKSNCFMSKYPQTSKLKGKKEESDPSEDNWNAHSDNNQKLNPQHMNGFPGNLAYNNTSDIEAIKFRKKDRLEKPKYKMPASLTADSFADDDTSRKEHADTSNHNNQIKNAIGSTPPFFNMFWNEVLQSKNPNQHSDSAANLAPTASNEDLLSTLEAYFASGSALFNQPFDINSILKIYQLQLQKNLAASLLSSKMAETSSNLALSSSQIDTDQSINRKGHHDSSDSQQAAFAKRQKKLTNMKKSNQFDP